MQTMKQRPLSEVQAEVTKAELEQYITEIEIAQMDQEQLITAHDIAIMELQNKLTP